MDFSETCESTYKVIIGHNMGVMLIITGLGWASSHVQPIRRLGEGLRLLRALKQKRAGSRNYTFVQIYDVCGQGHKFSQDLLLWIILTILYRYKVISNKFIIEYIYIHTILANRRTDIHRRPLMVYFHN